MKITRKWTKAGEDPFESVAWTRRSSRITNPDGSVVFQMDDAEVPEPWSQLATDIMVSKYFRKAGVPEDGGPEGLRATQEATKRRSDEATGEATERRSDGATKGRVSTGPERSARQVIHRLAGCWRHWGEAHGYFDSKTDAQAFYDELSYMMTHQIAAPNSPQWFNTGLHWAYGIEGPAQGHYVADPETGEVTRATDAYSHPQPHACFIQSVRDDLVNPGGIMDLWVREARLFKYGSGTGTNFSVLRAEDEPLAGGGKSSGLMSWLRIGDRAAGAIKSGGTTRRAAKMVCLDLDHPDIDAFVNWKVREELKVAAMVEGMKHLGEDQTRTAERLGLTLDYDFNGEAYYTVSGQNSNNSVRVPDSFFDVLDADGQWELRRRTDKEIARTLGADELWEQIGFAAWRCADPGVQFDSTINAWHTCPESGRINASNPCSEYMFLDDTACNLASVNLLRFYDADRGVFDWELYEHAIDLWTIVLEISVLMASFPSREIAKRSYRYRTLGLGYANLGALLMQAGVPYDSEAGRALCGALSAMLTGRSYRMSALMAREHGPFPGYQKNRQAMLRVIRNHKRAAHGLSRDAEEWEDLRIRPVPIDHSIIREIDTGLRNAADLLGRAVSAWDDALALGEKHGYRNAQTSVIAPTGTIGLLMDCDTTGVEPDFALVKFKKLAGGGYFKIVNQSLEPALAALGYSEDQVKDVLSYVMGSQCLDVPMPSTSGSLDDTAIGLSLREVLVEAGLREADLARIEQSLPGMFELSFAFSAWSLGDEALERVGLDGDKARKDPAFNLLRHLGLTPPQIEQLNEMVCGTQTIEDAPHILDEHLAVFDCANPCGKRGTRFIAAEGHIRMMAAAQPFISGAISKTINLPNSAGVEDIKRAYRLSWELGLKANALYRDGCKLSQPLSTKSEDGTAAVEADEPGDRQAELQLLIEDEDDEGVVMARLEVEREMRDVARSASIGDEVALADQAERIVHRPMRRRLPDTRRSLTHKFNIAGHEGYLTVGLYENGQPGELFITMAKEGSTIGGLMDSLGTAVSVALQYGVPIESLVKKFTHQRFEPAGMTTNRDIPFAKSLVDYIFRWMGMEFVEGYREANAPRRSGEKPGEEVPVGPETRMSEETARRVAAHPGAPVGSADREVDRSRRHGAQTRRSDVVDGGAGAIAKEDAAASGGATVLVERSEVTVQVASSALSEAMIDCQGDAPACDVCGTITVRNGACYKCLNCGHSMGCS